MEDVVGLEGARERVVAALRDAQIVVLPTDTVYAVVADAFQARATQRMFEVKQRGRAVPLGVVIRSPRQVNGLVADVPECAERLMASYWPGPLTLVFNSSESLSWDLGNTLGTIALRLPTDDLVLDVCAEIGPLACTAARVHGGSMPYTVGEAQRQLGDQVAVYVDGGRCDGPVSTIVDVTRGRAEVLRSGSIPDGHVEQVATGQVGWGQRPTEGGPDGSQTAEPSEEV
ncbi:MAG: L-threonylcarbamoyladenylate synthase [Egibacteraceae bacterium]